MKINHSLCIAAMCHLQQMAENSEAGDISAGMQVKLQGGIHCWTI